MPAKLGGSFVRVKGPKIYDVNMAGMLEPFVNRMSIPALKDLILLVARVRPHACAACVAFPYAAERLPRTVKAISCLRCSLKLTPSDIILLCRDGFGDDQRRPHHCGMYCDRVCASTCPPPILCAQRPRLCRCIDAHEGSRGRDCRSLRECPAFVMSIRIICAAQSVRCATRNFDFLRCAPRFGAGSAIFSPAGR